MESKEAAPKSGLFQCKPGRDLNALYIQYCFRW